MIMSPLSAAILTVTPAPCIYRGSRSVMRDRNEPVFLRLRGFRVSGRGGLDMSGATFAVALVMQIRIVGEIHPYSWTAKPCHQERVVLVVVTKDVVLPIDAGSKKGCSRMGSLWGSSFFGGPTLS